MTKGADQIALPLDWPQTEGESRFIVSKANQSAFDHFRNWSMWPVKSTVLTGPRRSGRTLLARTFAERVHGRVIDQAESRDEEEIFHAWNDAQDSGLPLVLVADEAPPAWSPKLPDLRTGKGDDADDSARTFERADDRRRGLGQPQVTASIRLCGSSFKFTR